LVGQKFHRAHLIEEDERPDHLPLDGWQSAANFHFAEVNRARNDQRLDSTDALPIAGNGIRTRAPTHDDVLRSMPMLAQHVYPAVLMWLSSLQLEEVTGM
jgi:hypothetical protein